MLKHFSFCKPALRVLPAALALLCAAPVGAFAQATAPAKASHAESLQAAVEGMAARARPAQFGIMVVELDSGVTARVNDNRAYMMMSTFKAPVAAAILHLVDEGKLSLDQKVHLTPADVVPGSAVPSVGEMVAKGATDVSVADLLNGSVSQSDNTAVDALIRLAGGGPVITAYLQGKGIEGMRIDMGERAVGNVFAKQGYEAAINMKENTTTLDGAVRFLTKLQAGELLSATSTKRLLDMMRAQVIPNRIRAGLPHGFEIADKTGTGGSEAGRTSAWNDMAIVTAPNGKRAVVAAFLRDTTASDAQRAAWFRDIGALVAADLQAP